VCLPVQAEYTSTCKKTNEQEVAALFDRWNSALASLDADKVSSLYAPDAVLLPTLSNKPRVNHEQIKDYFVHFLENKPQGRIDFRVIKVGCNVASDTGLYTFTLHDKKGVVGELSARYSFVYEYVNNEWLVEHHHSSVMPEQSGVEPRRQPSRSKAKKPARSEGGNEIFW
jgi:uncharacterized protein (TIGR02246 family)